MKIGRPLRIDKRAPVAAAAALLNGFELGDGRLHAANTLFSRQAYVGLSRNRYGTLTFGNQYAPLYDTMGDTFDPLTVGNYWQDSWTYNGIGNFLTVPNSVKYQFSYNGFSVDAIYGFGTHAGAMGLDSTYGVELTYAHGPASINTGFHQTSVSSLNGNSVNGAKVNFVHVSGAYQVTPAVLPQR
ncbi:porin [Burkholderia ubonensis]|uniref:porin n=1 Tax=Burkholderia ubonensis TaxID=101571 RepID=UPI001E3F515E|nr:porin [Burkholderia ubonensis]